VAGPRFRSLLCSAARSRSVKSRLITRPLKAVDSKRVYDGRYDGRVSEAAGNRELAEAFQAVRITTPARRRDLVVRVMPYGCCHVHSLAPIPLRPSKWKARPLLHPRYGRPHFQMDPVNDFIERARPACPVVSLRHSFSDSGSLSEDGSAIALLAPCNNPPCPLDRFKRSSSEALLAFEGRL